MLNYHDPKTFFVITVLTAFVIFLPALRGQDNTIPSSKIRAIIEADWDAQEKRLGRSVSSPQAIDAILFAADRLIADLSRGPDAPELGKERETLAKLGSVAADVDGLTDLGRVKLYHDIRWVVRSMALKNPLIAGKRILFMKRKRFICQMLHEYLGYYYDYEDISGGGIYLLEQPGYSFAYQDLTKNRLGRGNYTTLTLSYDAETIYFAFAARAAKKPNYYSTQRKCFHIYAMNLNGSNVRQITQGPDDDFDPCPLPDGGMAFMSSARGGFTRCNPLDCGLRSNIWGCG